MESPINASTTQSECSLNASGTEERKLLCTSILAKGYNSDTLSGFELRYKLCNERNPSLPRVRNSLGFWLDGGRI